MKRKNMAAMVTSIALVGVVAVGGTLALLSQSSNNVTNTFTVGEGYKENDVILNEAKITKDTSAANFGGYKEDEMAGEDDRVETNTYADLVQGTTLAKDPRFKISTNCSVEYSWIVAKIDGFNEHAGATQLSFASIDTSKTDSGEAWYHVTRQSDSKGGYTYNYTEITDRNFQTELVNDGVYLYGKPLQKGDTTEDLFQSLRVGEVVPVTGKDEGEKEQKKITDIVVSGYAVEGVYTTDTEGNKHADTSDAAKNAVMNQVASWAFGA